MLETLNQILHNHLQNIIRERDPYLATAGHFFVREYIRQEMAQWGNVAQYDFEVEGQTHQNLIVDLCYEARVSQKAPILIAAHYDTVPNSPGADDNGTGIAVLLALAQFFSNHRANYPLRFVAFDLEEYGLVGSSSYASFLKASHQPLRLMISLEMLGYCDTTPDSQQYPFGLQYFYPSTGDFIALVGNLMTIPDMITMSKMIKNCVPCEWLPVGLRGKFIPDTRRSDHAPFWDQGYQAMMVTDTANLRNPYYHLPSDTLATLDLEFLTRVCQGLIQAIQGIQ